MWEGQLLGTFPACAIGEEEKGLGGVGISVGEVTGSGVLVKCRLQTPQGVEPVTARGKRPHVARLSALSEKHRRWCQNPLI